MAVPKKKNKKVKFKYSVLKKQYLTKLKNGIIICIFCKLKKKEIITSNIVSKKKICLNCLNNILKKKKKIKNYEN